MTTLSKARDRTLPAWRIRPHPMNVWSLRMMVLSGVVRRADRNPPLVPSRREATTVDLVQGDPVQESMALKGWLSRMVLHCRPDRLLGRAFPDKGRRRRMTAVASRFIFSAALIGALLYPAAADAVRIKDIGAIEGVRENQLIGYGLVVGLDRTGDQVIGGQFTIQAMMSMLNKMGVNLVINPIQLLTRNIASVMVTSKLPPFSKPGMTLDAVVSSMANAKSLQGGTLLLTPLKAANQQVFAVAQGPVSIGGFVGGTGGPGGATVIKNHQVTGIVPGGAIIEKELLVDLESWETVSVLLRQPDFTTAIRTAEAIDGAFGKGSALAVNGGQVK
ncbi:MAG: flagellar basal body P-ring protein FlgI, partial [Nitrospira sp.]|nr:flagellar basal body P-ring protein FlgI [Nitrospira sp.]